MRRVIIGLSAAGVSAVETLRSGDEQSDIVAISDESLIYSRPLLSYYLATKLEMPRLLYRPSDFFERNRLTTVFTRASRIDLENQRVYLENGGVEPYDQLLIATGARPRYPRAAGIQKKGVFGLRRIEDVHGMFERLPGVKRVVVLGAGLVGLKAASALRHHDVEVTILVGSRHALSQMLDETSARVYEDIFRKHGVEIFTGVKPAAILGNEEVSGVETADGRVFPCEMVVVGKGVDPNMELVSDTRINTDYGIVVDNLCQTNVPGVFAAGDVAQAPDIIRGETWINALWPCAVEQGRIAALNMLGHEICYKGSMRMNSVQFFDLPVISAGLAVLTPGPLGARAGEHDETLEDRPSEFVYRKVFLKDDTIVGFVQIGEIGTAGLLKILMERRVDISHIKSELLSPRLSLGFLLPLIQDNRTLFDEREFQELMESVGV
jgi:NADPH-dependent 2,4-dienoyl-CoA reductase/sulfur reductase-like enzyme